MEKKEKKAELKPTYHLRFDNQTHNLCFTETYDEYWIARDLWRFEYRSDYWEIIKYLEHRAWKRTEYKMYTTEHWSLIYRARHRTFIEWLIDTFYTPLKRWRNWWE